MSGSSDLRSLVEKILERHQAAITQPKNLSRFKDLLNRLGNPQNHLPPVIHVAGTNGKGSVVAFIRAMLEARNYQVHSYTSPHLININERIALPDGPINTQELCHILEKILQITQSHPCSFFEVITAAAFAVFARNPADFCLLEVGLGGRLDPTNVIEHPIASVITRIDYDHTRILGQTLSEIACEKAGIFKYNVPAFTIPQNENIMRVLKNEAKDQLFIAPSLDPDCSIGLAGQFQRENAALAVHVLKNLPQIKLSPDAYSQGLKNVRWPGRLQRIKSSVTESKVWLDGAHNPGAAKAIAEHFQHLGISNLSIVFAMAQVKDPTAFLMPLRDIIRNVYCVPMPSDYLAWHPQEVQKQAKELGLQAFVGKNLQSAIRKAQGQDSSEQNLLICGSLVLVGQALQYTEDSLKISVS